LDLLIHPRVNPWCSVFDRIETKGYTQHPSITDTEPTITEIDLALKVRAKRERQFNRERLHPGHPQVAEYVDSVKEEVHIRSRSLTYQIFEIGKLLVDAKELLPHGSFDKWIEENFHFSKSTAINFCRVYRVCLGQPELVEFFKPSILYHLCAPGFPKDLREAIFDNVTGVFDLSKKELLELAIKYNRGEIGLDSPEVQGFLRRQKDGKYYKRLKILLGGLRRVLEVQRAKITSVVRRDMANPLIDPDDLEDLPLDEAGYIMDEPGCGMAIDAMITTWIAEINALERDWNPDDKRKSCANANVTFLENHKITNAQRAEGIRMRTKKAIEDAALTRKKRIRGKRFTRRS
jgi:hypothetical protein